MSSVLYNDIKQIAQKAVKSMIPADIELATVLEDSESLKAKAEAEKNKEQSDSETEQNKTKANEDTSDQTVSETGVVLQTGDYFTLPESAYIIPDIFGKFKCTVDGKEAVIDNSLKKDDTVILLRRHGGQKFIVIGRLPKDEDLDTEQEPENPEEDTEKKCKCGCPWETCPNNPDNKKDSESTEGGTGKDTDKDNKEQENGKTP